MVRFETTHGGFTVELYQEDAPATVENFLRYVDEGFFDGTIFHRIVPGFVIQGGGLNAEFTQKKTRAPVKNEAANGVRCRRTFRRSRRCRDIFTVGRRMALGSRSTMRWSCCRANGAVARRAHRRA